MLLAYRDGLSDERAMDALRFDLRWKLALDLPVDHPGFHPLGLIVHRYRGRKARYRGARKATLQAVWTAC